jgi:hypothetical protein
MKMGELNQYESIRVGLMLGAYMHSTTCDHAIELEPGAKPSVCKVYPLAPSCSWMYSERTFAQVVSIL